MEKNNKTLVEKPHVSKGKLVLWILIFLTIMHTFFVEFNFRIIQASTSDILLDFFLASFWIIIFYFIDIKFNLKFKKLHYFFVAFIVLASFIFGPIGYHTWKNYDKVLHVIQPIMLASIVFHMIRDMKISIKAKATFTYFIIAGLLGMFEVEEFALDRLFNLKLQGVYIVRTITDIKAAMDPLSDTHMDLLFGFTSTLIYCIILYFYFRNKK